MNFCECLNTKLRLYLSLRILFCHQNFPGQFTHIAAHLASKAGLESAVLNGQATAKVMDELKQKGFMPNVVIGHTDWARLCM